jgi:hypothetical protein
MFHAFASSGRVPGFQDLLDDAARRGGDPGTALVATLREGRYNGRVPGLNLDRVLSDPRLDPRNTPGNVLGFLGRIANDGAWGVNLSVRVD